MYVCPFVNTLMLEPFDLFQPLTLLKKHAVLAVYQNQSFVIRRNFELIEIRQGLCVNALGFKHSSNKMVLCQF